MEGGTSDTQHCSRSGLASRCRVRRSGVSPFNSPCFSTYSVFTRALTTPSGKKLSDVSTPPWLSENIYVAQDSKNNWGVCTNRKGLSKTDSTERKFSLYRSPRKDSLLCYCRQDSAAVLKRSISLKAVPAPACLALHSLLRTTPVPFSPLQAKGSLDFSLKDFNLWDKHNFTQADKSGLVSGETMQLIPDSLKDMTRVGSDQREQCVLCHISWI